MPGPIRGARIWLIVMVVLLIALGTATGVSIARKQGASASLRADVRAARRSIRQLEHAVENRQACEGATAAEPHVWLVPAEGPPGVRVQLVSDCFFGPEWRQWRGGYGMFLIRDFAPPSGCELIIGVDHPTLSIANGRAEGSFTVPSGAGDCFQQGSRHFLTPGPYRLGIGCHACEVADFRVTA